MKQSNIRLYARRRITAGTTTLARLVMAQTTRKTVFVAHFVRPNALGNFFYPQNVIRNCKSGDTMKRS